MDAQLIIVVLILAAAAAFGIRGVVRSLRSTVAKGDCGSDCGCGSARGHQ